MNRRPSRRLHRAPPWVHRICGAACALVVVASAACKAEATTQAPELVPDITMSDIAVQEIGCSECGEKLALALLKLPGVTGARFHTDSFDITVTYDANQANTQAFLKVGRDLGYRVTEGDGSGPDAPSVVFPPGVNVMQVSARGEDVDLMSVLVAGKITVFNFHASWCGPCKEVDRYMLEVLLVRQDVALRTIDVEDWDSPVAQHYLKDVPGLPYLLIYGPTGEQIDAIEGLDFARMDAALVP